MLSIDEKLVVALSRVTTELRKPILQHISDAGFTFGQFAVLEVLLHKGPRTVGELINDVLSSSGNIGVVVDNLLKADLVHKTPVEGDGRKRAISLTEKGKLKISAYYPKHKAELERILSNVEDTKKQELLRLLVGFKNDLTEKTTQL